MWKLLYDSAKGESHVRLGHPCQDYGFASVVRTATGPVLVAACADGAGSAEYSDVGARLAASGVVQSAAQDLQSGLPVADINRATVSEWLATARERVQAEADGRDVPLRQLASTLLLAVVGVDVAAFAQLGDGAIVRSDGDGYTPIFWPQSGEYANMTHFLTEAGYDGRFLFELRREAVDEVALFSDGVQPLALQYTTRTAHAPFFRPLFARLRASNDGELHVPLRQFLQSPAVAARSDDDKTLILATRRGG